MTDEEAAEMLRSLEKHYGQPVMPLSHFCRALETWAECIRKLNSEEPEPHHIRQGSDYHHWLGGILIDIRKSNLLARLLYAREPLRTRACPEHRGHWHGPSESSCPHGCGNTGWLREP